MASSSTLLFLLGAAGVAGFIDAIAGGGGLLTLPALLSLGLPPHLALGTNKGQSVFGATMSFATFWRKGLLQPKRILVGVSAGFTGSALGAFLQLHVPKEPLKPIVTALLALCVVLTFLPKPKQPRASLAHPLAIPLMAFALGAYDGFFGPGTGTFLVIGFMLLASDSLLVASANAKVVNWASNLAAVLLFSYRGTVHWELALPMAGANALGAWLGVRAAVHVGDGLVRWCLRAIAAALVIKLAFF
jgi:uncharacterized protein